LAKNIQAWNSALVTAAAAFQAKYTDASTFVYDSWSVHLNSINILFLLLLRTLYSKLLDNPSQYGFTDIKTSGGSFWQDVIHPKAKVHQYMAEDLQKFLISQTPAQLA